ncbi:MAG: EamA family transporter [Asgard group archaeon]|nr:EamA family transporter [Asgard group archaeon]
MKKKLAHWLKVATVVMGWALTPVIGDYLIDQKQELSPFQLAFFRYLIAAVVLYFILIFQSKVKNKDIWNSLQNNLLKYIFVAIFSAFMPVFLFLAVRDTTASTASFLLNANVVLIPIFAFFILKERIRKIYALAITLSLIGLFLVIFNEYLFNLSEFPMGALIGNLLAFGSGILWALYTVFLKKFFSTENPLLVTFVSLSLGSVILVFFAFLMPPREMSISVLGVFLVILLAILSTSLAYSFWLSLLQYLSATETGIIQTLVPITSVIISIIFLGETITWIFAIGALFILAGIFLVEMRRTKELEHITEKVD